MKVMDGAKMNCTYISDTDIKYQLIRSNRKTMTIQIKADGSVIVRVPQRISLVRVKRFVEEHREWIEKQLEKVSKTQQEHYSISEKEREKGIALAKVLIPYRVAYFAKIMNFTYSRITIREQKTRWGSCSSAGGLNFNWKLVLMPEEVLDYVVVHELAHRKEMNHSAAFWNEVAKIMPDYKLYRKWLKEQGGRYL